MKLFHRTDLLIAFGAICLLMIFIPIFTYMHFVGDLDTKENIMNRNNQGVTLFDRHGQVFFNFYQGQTKTIVPLNQVPKITQQAIMGAEDKDFYSHPGFSVKSIFGAFIANIRKGNFSYGGSTITQQLVKTSLLTSNKNILRKYQEVVLAQELERRYSKDEILEMYLNSVYFGQGTFGIEAAAKTYFNKSAKDLNLAESSLLAGILSAPSQMNPQTGDIGKAKERQRYVLEQMVEKKFIEPDQAEKAETEKIEFAPVKQTPYQAPHFALMVKNILIQKYGEEEIASSGWEVHTTLDLEWQKYAEKVVADQVTSLQRNKVSNGAAVVINPQTGEVLVMVGSKDWFDDKFGKLNISTALRPPGSAFKPIVYAAALEKQIITPATILKDQPITYSVKGSTDYKPLNYDRRFRGPVLARRALVNSLNIPAIEVLMKVGAPSVVEMAHKLGVDTINPETYHGPSFALGTDDVHLLELTNAYATFANHGQRNEITLIKDIYDKRETLIYHHEPNPQQVLSAEVAFQISSILSDNALRAESFGNTLNISRQAAVKTGTTENFKDAWTIGFTPQLAIGAWVGNNDNTVMDQVAGSLGAAPIWKNLMEYYLKGVAEKKFEPPAGIEKRLICQTQGLLTREASSSAYTEYFIKGTEPTKYCTNPNPASSPNSNPQPSNAKPTITKPEEKKDKKD